MRSTTLRTAAAVGAAGALLLASAAFTGPAYAADKAHVSVLHGVPGATVDVYVNGDALLTDFEPGTLTDPVPLAGGDYDLKVVAAGDGADGTAIMEANGVTVPAGANITVVAHLSDDGTPTLTPFVNDTDKLDAGKARVTVRHTAAAPAVDVRAGGSPVFEGLTNPNEESAVVDAGTIEADVVLAGTDTVAIGPADLNLKEGTNTIVYAWGSAEDENLDLAVQVISGMHKAPHGVPAGTGGQAASLASDSGTTSRGMLVGLAALCAAALAFGATRRAEQK